MIRGLIVLLVCQLIGEFLVTLVDIPVPGPVVGMVILFIGLRIHRPHAKSGVVRVADGVLSHLQLLFIPAGAGVIQYLPLLGQAWLPIVGGLVVSWLAALVSTAGAGVATLRLQSRLRAAAAPAEDLR
jgi:holin-like protein